MSQPATTNCSWVDGHGNRLFGTFIKWEGDYAIVRHIKFRARIYKANLTWEVG